MKVLMTDRQRSFARHALGFPNRKNTSYRNHFCIGPEGDGYSDWEEMVKAGWAVKRTGTLWGGMDMFYLTLEGARLAREPKEHLSREDAFMMHKLASK
jgi:hypothetical protein